MLIGQTALVSGFSYLHLRESLFTGQGDPTNAVKLIGVDSIEATSTVKF